MSGIEIAGLILGVVPLTIAALKQYKAAREMKHAIIHKSLYIDRLIQALEEQKFVFESEFRIMLRAAGLEQQEISTISGEYLQAILLRSDVAEGLSRYLGRGYDPYRNALVRCEASLKEIVRIIGGLVPGFSVSSSTAKPLPMVKGLKLIVGHGEVERSERSAKGERAQGGEVWVQKASQAKSQQR